MAKPGQAQAVVASKKLEMMADCILWAAFHGDESSATKFGVGKRTIQRWRKRSLSEPELAKLVAYRLDQVEGADVPDQLERSIQDMLEAVSAMTNRKTWSSEDMLAFAEIFKAVAGYDLTRKMLHERFKLLHGTGNS